MGAVGSRRWLLWSLILIMLLVDGGAAGFLVLIRCLFLRVSSRLFLISQVSRIPEGVPRHYLYY